MIELDAETITFRLPFDGSVCLVHKTFDCAPPPSPSSEHNNDMLA